MKLAVRFLNRNIRGNGQDDITSRACWHLAYVMYQAAKACFLFLTAGGLWNAAEVAFSNSPLKQRRRLGDDGLQVAWWGVDSVVVAIEDATTCTFGALVDF